MEGTNPVEGIIQGCHREKEQLNGGDGPTDRNGKGAGVGWLRIESFMLQWVFSEWYFLRIMCIGRLCIANVFSSITNKMQRYTIYLFL